MRFAAVALAAVAGMHGGGAGAGGARAPQGLFVGADTGGATMLGGAPARGEWAFGAGVGYQWRSGLALDARFDDLGVGSPSGSSPLLVGSGGVRYGVPIFVMPYVEARLGPAFYGPHATPTAGIGLGLGLPVFRHLAFELGGRDWIADVDGAIRHVLSFELGVAVGFDGH